MSCFKIDIKCFKKEIFEEFYCILLQDFIKKIMYDNLFSIYCKILNKQGQFNIMGKLAFLELNCAFYC